MTQGILTWLLTNWGIVAGVVAGIAAWNKDRIMRFVNVRKGKADAHKTEKQVDTVYIENSAKLVEIYGKSMDDLLARNNATIKAIKSQYEHDLSTMQIRYDDERRKDKIHDDRIKIKLDSTISSEKELSITVNELKKQIVRLSAEVKKLTGQLDYYRRYSNITPPENLQ